MEINSPFTMIVIIVLIAVGAGVINNYIKMKANREDDDASQRDDHQDRRNLQCHVEQSRNSGHHVKVKSLRN